MMCIIIDANVASELAGPSNDAKPIFDMVLNKKMSIVCGGELKKEIEKTRLRKLYRQLVLAGSLIEYSNDQLNPLVRDLRSQRLASNDSHVIALAMASGARILFSRDVKLHQDFKNRNILNNPRGKIYQSARHSEVLRDGVCRCADRLTQLR